MLYRNDAADAITLATEPPQTVQPGDTVDVDDHVAGLTPIDADGNPIDPPPAEATPTVGVDAPAVPDWTANAPTAAEPQGLAAIPAAIDPAAPAPADTHDQNPEPTP